MEMLLSLIGLAFVLVLIYVYLSGAAMPPAFKLVLLVVIGLVILYCLLTSMGCLPRPEHTARVLGASLVQT